MLRVDGEDQVPVVPPGSLGCRVQGLGFRVRVHRVLHDCHRSVAHVSLHRGTAPGSTCTTNRHPWANLERRTPSRVSRNDSRVVEGTILGVLLSRSSQEFVLLSLQVEKR